jgi:hypothetical protein
MLSPNVGDKPTYAEKKTHKIENLNYMEAEV